MKFIAICANAFDDPPVLEVVVYTDLESMANTVARPDNKAVESRYYTTLLAWGRRAKAGDRLAVEEMLVFAVPETSKFYEIREQPALATIPEPRGPASKKSDPPYDPEPRGGTAAPRPGKRNLAPRADD